MSITPQQLLDMQQRIERSKFIPLVAKRAESPLVKKGRTPHKEVQEQIYNEKKKKNKYNTSKKEDRTYNGKVYDSKWEMQYRQRLDKLKLAGIVVDIKEQVKFPLEVNGIKICSYILDFVVTYNSGSIKYIDCKGMKGGTPVYRIKKKLFEAIYPMEIEEAYAKDKTFATFAKDLTK